MLERDLAVAAFDPARHVLCARLREDGRMVGYVDVLDAHPEDGVPWLGVVEISAPVQGQGYGRQCVEAVVRRVEEDLGPLTLRAAADRDDRSSALFLQHVGFAAVAPSGRQSPQGPVSLTVFERRLAPGTLTR
jgi:RimJ/RimL family protein N-acetyltransferase